MSGPSIDAEAFRNFERAAHDSKADSYHDLFAVVTDRAIAPLLDAARVGAGTRMLDVAAGPGRLSAAAAARGAKTVGADLTPAMVALARRLQPGLDFREASAEQLPFADRSFDAVACGFGMGHFAEPERVISEIARVVISGGAVALSWWDDFSRSRINGIFYEVIGRLGLSAAGTLPQGPPIDRFSDRECFAAFLRSAGLDAVRVEAVSFTHRLRDADELWTVAMGSFARTSAMIRAQTDPVQQQVRAAVAEAAARYATPDGLEIPVAFLVASGTRPR